MKTIIQSVIAIASVCVLATFVGACLSSRGNNNATISMDQSAAIHMEQFLDNLSASAAR